MDNNFIHKSVEIGSNVSIGYGSKIWNNAQIREDCSIGKNVIISKDVYIDFGVKIGDGCKIQNSVSVFNGVTLENDVFVGPHVSFTNDKIPRAFNAKWNVVSTLVKKGASLGANCTIVCGVVIGEYAIVAAGSVVTKDVEPYSLVVGNPARHRYYINKNGDRVN